MNDRPFGGYRIFSRIMGGTLFAAILLGIATSCGPAGATGRDMACTTLNKPAVIRIGWDTGGFDRRFESRSAGGFDRQFDRSGFDRNHDASGWDRRFHDRSDRNYDTSGFDRPPNHFLNTRRRQ